MHRFVKMFLPYLLVFWSAHVNSSILEGALVKTSKDLVPVEAIVKGDILVGCLHASLAYVAVTDVSSTIVDKEIVITTAHGKT